MEMDPTFPFASPSRSLRGSGEVRLSFRHVRKLGFWTLTGLVVSFHSATAAQVGDVSVADSLRLAETIVHFYSGSIKAATFLGIDVYAVTLYLEEAGTPPDEVLLSNQVKVVEVTFLRDVRRERLSAGWLRELKTCCPDSCSTLLAAASLLAEELPDIEKGDRITYHLHPGWVDVYVNDRILGVLVDPRASFSVLSAFVGRNAPDRLRCELLRGAKG